MKMNEKQEAARPLFHYVDTVDSCMDEAYRLIRQERLPVWDSVQANMQTEGRGQMRRRWESLQGNVFAALRLPENSPFNGTAAAIAISTLCASALRSLCCLVYVKWPNDLVMLKNDKVVKVGGILVEERPEGIIAGIGINLASAPAVEELDRKDSLLPGILLGKSESVKLPDKWELWRALVKHVHSIYRNEAVFENVWQDLADELLLWRSLKVKVEDGDLNKMGILLGIAGNGAALLKTADGVEEITHGQMYLEDSSSQR